MDSEQDKQIIEIDPKSGFCFGVINAIKQAEEALKTNQKLYCLGDIVHNGAEVSRLEKIGLITITHEQFKKLHDCTVLLRAHGEPPETYEIAHTNNLKIIDATCPVVLQLQKKIKKGYLATKEKQGQILLFGKEGHAEIIGLKGQTDNNALIITNKEDISKIDFTKPIQLFSQTTKSLHDFKELKLNIQQNIDTLSKEKENKIDFIAHDTICRQVSNREAELSKFAQKFEVIIFVSGKKSSNGKVLFDFCKQVNPNTFFVSCVDDLELAPVKNAKSIGICGATSTPKWLMEDIAKRITELNA